MPNISTPAIPAGPDFTVTSKQNKKTAESGFDAALLNAGTNADVKELAGTFLDSIMRAMNDNIKALMGKNATKSAFEFSSAFKAAFGDSGPLIDFINVTTAKLNLSAEQNQALQNIAIHNKDITKTPANVQKIADQLKQAGIM